MEVFMSTINETTSPTVVLMLPRGNHALIMFAKATHAALLNNPNFPNPSPTLAVFKQDTDAYEEAETKCRRSALSAAR
jgi:hypothetical protein